MCVDFEKKQKPKLNVLVLDLQPATKEKAFGGFLKAGPKYNLCKLSQSIKR